MGDFGKGIKSFKQGMSDEDNKPVSPPPAQIPPQPAVQPGAQPQATLNGETVVDTSQPGR
jgi:sec-independent protein translocase protein TatA